MSKLPRADELEYLRWFHANADFGPADSDVREILNERFERQKGMTVPEGYDDE